MEHPREHIYLCSLLWDGLWIIQQPICNEIQKDEPVLFVERPVSVFTVLRYPSLWRQLFAWMRGARRITSRLRVLAPLPLFHLGHRFPTLFRLEFAIQRWWILRWEGAAPRTTRVMWFDNPLFECAVGRMGESLAVYHVGDEVGEFQTSHRPSMARLEARALRRASVVFAAADELARVRRPMNSRTVAIWNAIDTSVFTSEDRVGAFVDVDAIPPPRIAFVGVLDTWVDLKLLEEVARALPEVSLVAVGPSRVDDRCLRALPNVHWLGLRHRSLIPGILRRSSASLVPFVESALTVNIVPAKVFEALAAGIVPVCTAFSRNLDALEALGLVLVARDRSQYIDLVRRAIRDDTPSRRSELQGFGLRQTWAERWRQMRDILVDVERHEDGPRPELGSGSGR
jgi:glycosyltransferase involved in cell wall biosynthesis